MTYPDQNHMQSDNILEQLRDIWSEVETAPFTEAMKRPVTHRMLSSRDRLKRTYSVLLAVAIAMALISVPNIHLIGLPLWMGIAMSAFFCLMALLVYLQRSLVCELDFGMSTVAALLGNLDRLQRFRTAHIIIGCVTALPILTAMMHYFFRTDPYLFAGAMAGALTGMTIGIITNLRTRRMIRTIRRELTD